VLQVTQTLKDEMGKEKDQYFAKVEELKQENKTFNPQEKKLT